MNMDDLGVTPQFRKPPYGGHIRTLEWNNKSTKRCFLSEILFFLGDLSDFPFSFFTSWLCGGVVSQPTWELDGIWWKRQNVDLRTSATQTTQNNQMPAWNEGSNMFEMIGESQKLWKMSHKDQSDLTWGSWGDSMWFNGGSKTSN